MKRQGRKAQTGDGCTKRQLSEREREREGQRSQALSFRISAVTRASPPLSLRMRMMRQLRL